MLFKSNNQASDFFLCARESLSLFVFLYLGRRSWVHKR